MFVYIFVKIFKILKKMKIFEFVGKDYIYFYIINNFMCYLIRLSIKILE